MESEERSLPNLVKNLSQLIKKKRNSSQPGELNEVWTKIALIVPLLEVLGWDKGIDITYEAGPFDTGERLDLILKCQTPIGIKTKNFDEIPPRNLDHPQIKIGLEQCKVKELSYFIWTNGDCWQFVSLALANAPLYQIVMSETEDEVSIADKLLIINKDALTAYPGSYNNTIRENWRMTALPDAWKSVLKEHTNDFLRLLRKGLPSELNIKDEVILEFMQKMNSHDLQLSTKPLQPSTSKDWQQLLDSSAPYYYMARNRLRSGYYLKLGVHLISENYKPLSMTSTYLNEHLKVINLFEEWGFIKGAGNNTYRRVEESIPYLKKLLEAQDSHNLI